MSDALSEETVIHAQRLILDAKRPARLEAGRRWQWDAPKRELPDHKGYLSSILCREDMAQGANSGFSEFSRNCHTK